MVQQRQELLLALPMAVVRDSRWQSKSWSSCSTTGRSMRLQGEVEKERRTHKDDAVGGDGGRIGGAPSIAIASHTGEGAGGDGVEEEVAVGGGCSHERLPIVPFFGALADALQPYPPSAFAAAGAQAQGEAAADDDDGSNEAGAASWLLAEPDNSHEDSAAAAANTLFAESDAYLGVDLDFARQNAKVDWYELVEI